VVPFIEPADMIHGAPLPGWEGRFFHSANMTFAQWTIEADAAPLHEHHHEQEEVWNVVEGEILLSVDGEERVLGVGDVAVISPDTPHSAQARTRCRAIVADYPLRHELPGVAGAEDRAVGRVQG
jgi:mannose-6-phosphate isomerase-like protein (cupin superfamily)